MQRDSGIAIAHAVSPRRLMFAFSGAIIGMVGGVGAGFAVGREAEPAASIAWLSLGVIHAIAFVPSAVLARRGATAIVGSCFISLAFPYWAMVGVVGGPLLQSAIWSIVLACLFGLSRALLYGIAIGAISTVFWIVPGPPQEITHTGSRLAIVSWHVLASLLVLYLGIVAHGRTPRARLHRGLCPKCVHSLEGLPPNAPCPECGCAISKL